MNSEFSSQWYRLHVPISCRQFSLSNLTFMNTICYVCVCMCVWHSPSTIHVPTLRIPNLLVMQKKIYGYVVYSAICEHTAGHSAHYKWIINTQRREHWIKIGKNIKYFIIIIHKFKKYNHSFNSFQFETYKNASGTWKERDEAIQTK